MDKGDKKFSFFESYHRALQRVSDERYGRMVRAMSSFVFNDEKPNFSDDADWVVWELMRPILERGIEISKIRSEAGGNGGRRGKGVSRNNGNKNAVKVKKQKQNNSKQKQNNSKQKQNNSKQKQNNSGVGIEIGIGKDISDTNVSSIEPNGSSSICIDVACCDAIDFGGLLEYFNTKMKGKAIPTISRMTEKRKKAINARIAEYGKESVQKVIDNAADSDFLNGGGERGFCASFDWLFLPNNFLKVLEGNYANVVPVTKTDRERLQRRNDAANLIMQLQQEGVESDD